MDGSLTTHKWSPDGGTTCFNGEAFNLTFDFSSPPVHAPQPGCGRPCLRHPDLRREPDRRERTLQLPECEYPQWRGRHCRNRCQHRRDPLEQHLRRSASRPGYRYGMDALRARHSRSRRPGLRDDPGRPRGPGRRDDCRRDRQHDPGCATTLASAAHRPFVTGPSTPPAGTGSLALTTVDNTSHAQLYGYQFIGTRLDSDLVADLQHVSERRARGDRAHP